MIVRFYTPKCINKAQIESILWKTGVAEGGWDDMKDGVEESLQAINITTEVPVQELNHKFLAHPRLSLNTLANGSLYY